MKTINYLLLAASLVMGTLSAEEFTPRITIVNNTGKHVWLRRQKLAFSVPKNKQKTFYHKPHNLYLSVENKDASIDLIFNNTWCIIDPNPMFPNDENCWVKDPEGIEPYRQPSCSNPLITQEHIATAQRERKDIVATISDGNTRPISGAVEYVERRGYISSIWHSTKSFVGSLFGRP
jgi:hypothetical protein